MRFVLVALLLFNCVLSYAGNLNENDKRLSALSKEKVDLGKKNIQRYKLYFQEFEGNFALFYDYKGEVIYLRYRIDRWDYKASRYWKKKLYRGKLYDLSFSWLGYLYQKPIVDALPQVTLANLAKKIQLAIPKLNLFRSSSRVPVGSITHSKKAIIEYLRY